jgi:DNA repair protein RecO (recombination protein O)
MPVHETEAIVLRQYALTDSDRIIVFITREFGKIRAAAHGVKNPKSRLCGCLEPLNHLRLEFYLREGRDLGKVKQVDIIHSYLGKNPSLPQICAFSYFAELANETVQENQSNSSLYRLLLTSLRAGQAEISIQALVYYFEIWCLRLCGFLPNYAYCSNCGKCVKDEGFFAWIEAGHARCGECAGGRGLRIGKVAAAALQLMERVPPGVFASQSIEKIAASELENLSQRLLELHLEKRLKSYRMLKEVLQSQ